MFDPMSELNGGAPSGDSFSSQPREQREPRPPRQQGAGGKFSDELHSVTIHARQRTFYIDLKQSNNGKFFKLSEKSRGGQKTTIMFDSEDLEKFIAAFEEMKAHV